MPAPYMQFTREEWAAAALRADPSFNPDEIAGLAATGEPVSPDEIVQVYGPLTEVLALLAAAKRHTHSRLDEVLGTTTAQQPFVIGLAGSVAVGKSTAGRVLQATLGDHFRNVELLPTDGFLYPNAVLEARGLLQRKGFPESYDQRALIAILAAMTAGEREVRVPVYSHLLYDIVPGEANVIRDPEIVIVEGLNVLQVNTRHASREHVVASDFFDFSIYVDAEEADIARWFTERLLALSATVLQDPTAYFHRFAGMSAEEIVAEAERIWAEINVINLRENIAPTRGRADLILEKDVEHHVQRVLLRRS
jgi:type I pantothenate kinase